MASFSISAPKALDDTNIAIQDDTPEFSRTTRTFSVSSPGSQTFTSTALISSQNFVTGTSIPLARPNKMVNTVERPKTGQVYPRTI